MIYNIGRNNAGKHPSNKSELHLSGTENRVKISLDEFNLISTQELMAQKVSMADIARELNVSQATVSYVLNGREGSLVSAATRERVLAVARQMGYQRNRAAQALAGQRSYLIELCVHGFYPAFYARALDEFQRQIGPTPYQLHIVNPSHWSEKDWQDTDGGWPVDGVITYDTQLPEQVIHSLRQRGTPIVAPGISPNLSLDHVKVDLNPALFEALNYLAARAQRVAYLTPWTAERAAADPDPRYYAYQKVMRELKRSEELIVAPGESGMGTRASMREKVKEHITQHGCPDAIFCFNDERSVAALAALRDLKLRVPQDVMLVGCDGIEETLYHSPTLSTIEYPIEETARLAWQLMRRRLEEPDAPVQSATLTARLALRESSAR